MTTNQQPLTIVAGDVIEAGAYKFRIRRLDGQGELALTLSKYADPRPTIPPVGTRIRAGLDGDGYVRAIETLAPAPTGTPHNDGPIGPDRDRRIVRQAVLNTAVALTATWGKPVDVPTVITIAETLEAWVLRACDPETAAN